MPSVVLLGALALSCGSDVTTKPYSDQGTTSAANTSAGTSGALATGNAATTAAAGTTVAGGTALAGVTTGASATTLGEASGTSTTGIAATAGGSTGGLTTTGGAANSAGGAGNTAAVTGGANTTTGGATASSSTGSTTMTGSCDSGSVTVNRHPLGCSFGWGAPDNPNLGVDMVSTWVGFEANGGLNGACNGCNLASDVAQGGPMVIYYAYFIGYQANLQAGYGDCNVDGDGQTLCTQGAQWIRDNRSSIVQMYGNYARMTYEASPNKGVIWWLEGDFIQYSYSDQNNPLSMQELGDLARDITCAIKSNQPNAVVAVNHSPWISNEEADAFWSAMPTDVVDMAWVQGPGDSPNYVNSAAYNATTANYAWLTSKTSVTIMAETSWAAQGQNDRWTTAGASAINARISEGVIGVLVNNPGGNYASTVSGLSGQLSSVCQ